MKILFFFLLFLGACTGSTSGGIKIIRHILLFKNSTLELKRQLHPSGIIPIRFNGKTVSESISHNVSGFILIYALIFILGSLLLGMMNLDLETSIGAVATSLGNVGPAIGSVGPVDNFAHLPDLAKWLLAILMLVGRLELFTVLVLFTPYFWRSN